MVREHGFSKNISQLPIFKIQSCVLFSGFCTTWYSGHIQVTSNIRVILMKSIPGNKNAKCEAPRLWPPDVKIWLIVKDLDAGKDWEQEEKGATEDEMVGWHHQLRDMSLTNSGRWWRTGKPDVQQSIGLQRAGHDLATEQQCDLMKSHILKMKATFYLFSSTWSQIGYTK